MKKAPPNIEKQTPLLASAKQRTSDVIKKLKKTMTAIELDLQSHEGIYPFNKGRLTQAEVCRRAGISKMTLQGDSHKTSTKVEVDEWLSSVKVKAIQGNRNMRRAVTDRADQWKSELEALAQQFHETKLQMIVLSDELETIKKERDAAIIEIKKLLKTSKSPGIIRKVF